MFVKIQELINGRKLKNLSRKFYWDTQKMIQSKPVSRSYFGGMYSTPIKFKFFDMTYNLIQVVLAWKSRKKNRSKLHHSDVKSVFSSYLCLIVWNILVWPKNEANYFFTALYWCVTWGSGGRAVMWTQNGNSVKIGGSIQDVLALFTAFFSLVLSFVLPYFTSGFVA